MCFPFFHFGPFWCFGMCRAAFHLLHSIVGALLGAHSFHLISCFAAASCRLPDAYGSHTRYMIYDIWIMNICDLMGSGAWCIVWVWIREKKVAPSFATKVSFAGTWPARPFMWTVELHSFSKMRERKTVVAWGCLVGSGAKLRKVRLSDAFSLGFQYIFLIWCWHILIICWEVFPLTNNQHGQPGFSTLVATVSGMSGTWSGPLATRKLRTTGWWLCAGIATGWPTVLLGPAQEERPRKSHQR
jgi:hypothetical protein